MPIKLEDLLPFMGGPFPRLDEVCEGDHILEVAARLTKWRTAAPRFGLDAAAIEDLDNSRHDEEGKRQQMLFKWVEAEGGDATYRALATVLLQLQKRSLAEKLLRWSNEDTTKKKQTRSIKKLVYNRDDNSTVRSVAPVDRTPSDLIMKTSPHLFTHQEGEGPQSVASVSPPEAPALEQEPTEPVVAMQSYDESPSRGTEMVSTSMSFYPPDIQERLVAVAEKATSHAELQEDVAEMMHYKHEAQQLEQKQKYAERKLRDMKAERKEDKEEIKLLKQQLWEKECALKKSELLRKELATKLQKMSSKYDMKQVWIQQAHMDVECLSKKFQLMRSDDRMGHNSTDYGTINTDSGEVHDSTGSNIDDELQQCMEAWYLEVEKHFGEQIRSEIAEHRNRFLQVNTRVKVAVSKLLQRLPGNDIDSAGLKEDLQWLQTHLDNHMVPQRTSSWP